MTRDGMWANQPLWRYALIGSAVAHVGLFALLTQVRVPSAAGVTRLRATPIPVELVTPPKPKPAPAVVVPEVRPTPPPPKPRPKPAPAATVKPPKPAAPKPVHPEPRPTPHPTPAKPTPVPVTPRPDPTPAGTSPPSGGGAPVGLGTLAPGGDLPVEAGAGTGGTPVGSVPGTGTGSGSGSGPGTGEGPPGTAEPKPDPGPPPPPPEPKPKPPPPKPKPPQHTSTLADRTYPELVKRVNPTYPLSAKEEGIEGTAKIRLRVNTDGSMSNLLVVNSSGDGRLDDAAIAAVKKWQYKPAVQNGVPRAVLTYASVTFRLE